MTMVSVTADQANALRRKPKKILSGLQLRTVPVVDNPTKVHQKERQAALATLMGAGRFQFKSKQAS